MDKYINAYETYNFILDEDIDMKILRLIKENILSTRDIFEELKNITKEELKFEDVIKVINTELNEKRVYKIEKEVYKTEELYHVGTYTTSIGNILVKESDSLKVIEYLLKAIKTRNSIIIEDENYDMYDLKHFILQSIHIALEKCNVNINLVDIIDSKDKNEFIKENKEKFDLIINLKDSEGEYFKSKNKSNYLYVYLENRDFINEASIEVNEMNQILNGWYEAKILTGDMRSVVDEINKGKTLESVIFTKDRNKAYEFINSVHSKNVFVNIGLKNIKSIKENIKEDKEIDIIDMFYNKKYIIYPANGKIN